jgi:hypothetical protein
MNLAGFGAGAGLAAVGAGVMAAWSYVRTAIGYATNLIIGQATIKHEAGEAIMSFCFNKAVRSPLGMRVFGGTDSYVHPKRWNETVGYECMSSQPFMIRYNKQFAFIGMMSFAGKGESQNIGAFESANTVTIRYVRGFFNLNEFINDAIEHFNKQNRQNNGGPKISRFRVIRFSSPGRHSDGAIESQDGPAGASPKATRGEGNVERMILTGAFRLLKWKREDLQYQPEEGQTPFTGYPFPPNIAEGIQEVDRWLKNEKWFRSKSIPWRLGWLLHGPPGTGKSTLVRALGMTFNMPVYMFDLAGMTNSEFTNKWDQMLGNTPCIPLIEDVDTVFNGREYVGTQSPQRDHLTFDCLLNCISGVKQADGVFLIVTTNRVETIDPALGVPDKTTGRSSRPGRIDRALFLGLMAEPERLKLAQHILSDFPALVDETVKKGEGETAAQFQARCADLALSQFWKKT